MEGVPASGGIAGAHEGQTADFVRATLTLHWLVKQLQRSRRSVHRLHRIYRGCPACLASGNAWRAGGVGVCSSCHRPCLDVGLT